MLKMKNNLNREIWNYFFLFSLLILGFLWLFQVLFLDNYYKSIRTQDIKSVANILENKQDQKNYEQLINDIAFEKEVCVEIINQDLYSLYSSSFFGKGCLSNKNLTRNYKYDFLRSNSNQKAYQIINPNYNNKILVYALKLNNNKYAFINTSLVPIDTTATIIRKQLLVITVIILILAFVISYFISHHISKPIVKITKAAKELAKNNYNITFDNDSKILELKELANTLNYMRDELSKTEELRRDLMANVSHDLKTPLTMIKAYSEMTIDLHKDNKEKQKENMEIVISEVDRLTNLVNDILTLSKMQSNIEQLHIEKFDLIDLVNEILKKYQVFKELNNYKFVFLHQDQKIFIEADKKKLEQVIYNLINNAINYTGDDLTITIVITNNKENILVEIKDSGSGIDKKDIPYIWDKYYKNQKKHKRNIIGTGLGLSIVKNIFELHHYEYGVKSQKNKGSNFYFYISKKDDFN